MQHITRKKLHKRKSPISLDAGGARLLACGNLAHQSTFIESASHTHLKRRFKTAAMENIVVYNESFAGITYHPNLKMIKVVWNGAFTKEQYQSAIEAALEFQKKSATPIENYLSNILKQGIVNPESRKWFEQVAMPRAIEQGLKKAGVVFDGNVFKKYYLNLILQATNKFKLPLRFFNTEEEAMSWFSTLT